MISVVVAALSALGAQTPGGWVDDIVTDAGWVIDSTNVVSGKQLQSKAVSPRLDPTVQASPFPPSVRGLGRITQRGDPRVSEPYSYLMGGD